MTTCLRVVRIYGWMSLIVSHHLAKFSCINLVVVKIMYLICHVTLQYYKIKGQSDIMGKSLSLCVTTLPSLVVISIVVVEMFLTCHVIPKEHVIKKGSYDFMGRSLPR